MAEERDWFAVPLEALGLTPRGLSRARKAGAGSVGELCQLTDEQLAATSGGMAEESRREIRERLRAFGLRLRDDKAGACVIREK